MPPKSSRPTLIYLHQYFATPDDGQGTRSYELARRLVARGFRVHMVTSCQRGDRATRHEVIEGIEVHWIRVPYDNSMGFAHRVFAFLKFSILACVLVLRIRADLVFATSTPLTIAIPALVGKWIKRVPLVFEVRDLWPELPVAIGALRNPVLIRGAQALERTVYRASEHVVGLSPGMCEGIKRTGVPAERVSLIPNSCDFDRFAVDSGAAADFRAVRPWLGSGPIVLYAGTFGAINGVSWFVDLAAKVRELDPEVRFLAIGAGLERKLIADRARALGLMDDTLFIEDRIPKKEMPACLAAASVCCSLFLPLEAMEHNSANKFFDALAAGRPVLINYGGWHRDLVRGEDIGIAARHDDLDATAVELVALLGDESRLRDAGERARALGRRRFSREMLAAQFGDVIAGALNSERLRAGVRSLPPMPRDV